MSVLESLAVSSLELRGFLEPQTRSAETGTAPGWGSSSLLVAEVSSSLFSAHLLVLDSPGVPVVGHRQPGGNFILGTRTLHHNRLTPELQENPRAGFLNSSLIDILCR